MPTTKGTRDERLAIPLKLDELELIRSAAKAAGLAPTTFARQVLLRRSQAFLDRQLTRVPDRRLTHADTELFLKALAQPPAPNAALLDAVQGIRAEAPAMSSPAQAIRVDGSSQRASAQSVTEPVSASVRD
jgi:uncharacterized protein (DUF1778 family)